MFPLTLFINVFEGGYRKFQRLGQRPETKIV